jgi:hypothetical protein
MNGDDYDIFHNVKFGSVISYDLNDWIIIVSPEDDEIVSVQAYESVHIDKKPLILTQNGWVEIF